MKLKAEQIFHLQNPLAFLTSPDVKLPIQARMRLASFREQITPFLKAIDNERVALIKEFGTEDESGNPSVSPQVDGKENPKWAEFAEQFVALMGVELDVHIDPLPSAMFAHVELNELLYQQLAPFFDKTAPKVEEEVKPAPFPKWRGGKPEEKKLEVVKKKGKPSAE